MKKYVLIEEYPSSPILGTIKDKLSKLEKDSKFWLELNDTKTLSLIDILNSEFGVGNKDFVNSPFFERLKTIVDNQTF